MEDESGAPVSGWCVTLTRHVTSVYTLHPDTHDISVNVLP